jgi:hypothetical protein
VNPFGFRLVTMPLTINDGSKSAQLDGLFLEVSGISGSGQSRRIGVESIVDVAVVGTGGSLMFGVRTRKGGFTVAISPARRAEWEALAAAALAARDAALEAETSGR